ncbi:MAG: hypothetical protein KH250_03315 [Bifidobacterium longum]|nr:hypothetical protein [Bifidobacterium longum]
MNTDDFGEIAFTPRRYDDTARYLGLSPDSVRRWSTTAVMYSRIGMRIGSLIHAIAMESGASEAFIRENATQGRLHYLHTKRIPKEHIVELLTMTIIQEQMDFDGDSIRHAPLHLQHYFFQRRLDSVHFLVRGPYVHGGQFRHGTLDIKNSRRTALAGL